MFSVIQERIAGGLEAFEMEAEFEREGAASGAGLSPRGSSSDDFVYGAKFRNLFKHYLNDGHQGNGKKNAYWPP